jgi:hypothetical protein
MRRPGAAGGALVGLVAVSSLLRGFAGSLVPSPWFTPDELVYGELGKSLYRLGRFEILGTTPDFYGLVYPALVGFPLHVAGVERGYELLKPLQALEMSSAAIVVYFWASALAPRRLALVAAALTLAVPGLAYSGFLMTEVAFYPILVLSAWAIARALSRPTAARQALAILAILVATMTRLQAVVLVPALVLAIGLDAWFGRKGVRQTARAFPMVAALVALIGAWIVVTRARGGEALGAYQTVSTVSFGIGDVFRFGFYHASDLLLMTAVVPVAALALLVSRAVVQGERSADACAFLAVTVASTLALLGQVAVFSSRLVGHLAERNLLGVVPLCFVGLVLWLGRDAPRPFIPTLLVATAGATLLALAPWNVLARDVALPDAFSMIPLNRLVAHHPALDPRAVVAVVGAVLLAAWAWLPRRLLPLVVVASFGLLLAASIVVSRVVATDARGFRSIMIGNENRWIDGAAAGPVAFVYAGERPWAAGAQVWENIFWNEKIDRVLDLFHARIAGSIRPEHVRVRADGRLVREDGRPAGAEYVVTSTRWSVIGHPVAASPAGMTLWRTTPPLRMRTRLVGIDTATAQLSLRAAFVVYGCTGGRARLTLSATPHGTTLEIRSSSTSRRVSLSPGAHWQGLVPLRPRAEGPCRIDVLGGEARLEAFEATQ